MGDWRVGCIGLRSPGRRGARLVGVPGRGRWKIGWPGTGRPGAGRRWPMGTPGAPAGATGRKGALYTGRGPVWGTIMRGSGVDGWTGALGAAGLGGHGRRLRRRRRWWPWCSHWRRRAARQHWRRDRRSHRPGCYRRRSRRLGGGAGGGGAVKVGLGVEVGTTNFGGATGGGTGAWRYRMSRCGRRARNRRPGLDRWRRNRGRWHSGGRTLLFADDGP